MVDNWSKVGTRILSVFTILLLCLSVHVQADDEFTKVPLLVNVLKGVTADANDIADTVKEANKILKKAKIQLEFDKTKNIKTDVSDTDNNDGQIQLSEEKALDEAGRTELDNTFGKGKGIKVYITNKIRGSNNKRGLAPHVKKENGKLTAKPVIYLKKTTATKQSKGNDLAHEGTHVFTLGKNHWIDKAKGVKADDKWHSNDPNNLLYAYNPYTHDGNSHDRGTKLTDDQIKEIKKGAKRLGKTKVAKKAQKSGSSAYEICDLPTIHGGFVDEMGETINEYADLGAGSFFAETPGSELEISILTEGLFPVSPINMQLSFYIDADNDPLTGDVIHTYQGIDKVIDVQLSGNHPGGETGAFILDVDAGDAVFLAGTRTERISKIFDANEPALSLESDYVDGIHLSLPIESLQLTDVAVPVYVTLEDFNNGDFDETQFVWELLDSAPQFQLDNTLLPYGEPVTFSGSNFSPLSDVDILLDDQTLCTVQADGLGVISGSMDLDFQMPGELDSPEYFFVTARDVSGGFDFSILEFQHNPANLVEPFDDMVDFADFAFFALNWLETDWPQTGFDITCTGCSP